MKKNLKKKDAERERPRRLVLSRETLQLLSDPSLLTVGGGTLNDGVVATTSTVSGDVPTDGGC